MSYIIYFFNHTITLNVKFAIDSRYTPKWYNNKFTDLLSDDLWSNSPKLQIPVHGALINSYG